MKKIYLILLILPFCFSANAQKFIKIEDKTFNWGGKVGVNAALPIVKSLTIDNQEMEDIRLQYKVGYQAAVFARVNIDRFYIQPSLAWQYTEGDIRFNIPQTENSLPDGTNTQMPIGKNRITYKSATLEVPVMIGYYLVKEGPYALSMMFGPNIKYNYKTRYSTEYMQSVPEAMPSKRRRGRNHRKNGGCRCDRNGYPSLFLHNKRSNENPDRPLLWKIHGDERQRILFHRNGSRRRP